MVKTYCDRCGKEHIPSDMPMIMNNYFGRVFSESEIRCDLCWDCRAELSALVSDWMEGKDFYQKEKEEIFAYLDGVADGLREGSKDADSN